MYWHSNLKANPKQRNILQNPLETDFFIRGIAGTGKSFTLINRMVDVVDADSPNIIFVTAHNHMVLFYLRNHLRDARPKYGGDKHLQLIVEDCFWDGDLDEIIAKAISEWRSSESEKPPKIAIFMSNTVMGFYLKKKRNSKKNAVGKFKDEGFTANFFIDEAQSISRIFFDDLMKFGLEISAASSFMVAADDNQVLEEGGSGDEAGTVIGEYVTPPITDDAIHEVFIKHGRPDYLKETLHVNIRNPEKVFRIMERCLFRLSGGQTMTSQQRNLVQSDAPVLFSRTIGKNELYDSIAQLCKNRPNESFAVILFSSQHENVQALDRELRKRIGPRVRRYQYRDGKRLREADFDSETTVWVTNIYSVRGTEFTNVIIPFFTADLNWHSPNNLPNGAAKNRIETTFDKYTYISASRARGNLICHSSPEYIEDLVKADIIDTDLYELILDHPPKI